MLIATMEKPIWANSKEPQTKTRKKRKPTTTTTTTTTNHQINESLVSVQTENMIGMFIKSRCYARQCVVTYFIMFFWDLLYILIHLHIEYRSIKPECVYTSFDLSIQSTFIHRWYEGAQHKKHSLYEHRVVSTVYIMCQYLDRFDSEQRKLTTTSTFSLCTQ